MKPLNSNTEGCNPISSNCVIWQGPDIECIKLCKGDTVSDVVYKLATELCMLIEMTDVKSYDLQCININGCDPKDFQELIQIIINKICTDNGIPTGDQSGRFSGGSDTIVPIAECFYYKTELGDTVTTMPVSDYARAIGNKLCDVIAQILTINEILANHEERITTLENTPVPIPVIPQVTPICVGPALPTPMETVLTAIEQQFCQLQNATGAPTRIYNGISAQCVNLNNSPSLGVAGGIMATLPGWITTPANIADSMNNIWLTLCDLRSAVRQIQDTCCPSGCSGIEINLTANYSLGTITIYLNGNIPAGFVDCDGLGSLFTITDTAGGSLSQRINVSAYMNVFAGYPIVIPPGTLNLGSDFTIKSDACLYNAGTGATCQFCLEYFLDNTATCPAVAVTSTTDTAVNFSYSPIVVPATYTVQLWDGAGTTVLQQVVTSVLSSGTQTGTFNGLTASTDYRIRIVVSLTGTDTECPFVPFTTTPVVCNEPTAVGGVIELPTICPMCGPVVDFVSNPSVDGYYIDDTSPYLLLRSGGTFNSIFNDNYLAAMPGVPSPATVSIRNSVTTPDGKTYISYNDNTAASASIIYRYDDTGTLQNTITLPFPGATSLRCNNMVYSEFDGKVYFISWANGTLGTTTRLCMLDPATDTVTSTFTAINAAIAGVFPNVFANPVNGVLYISTNVVTILAVNPATDTVITTIANAGYIQFNKDNGDFWVMQNGVNTMNVYDINNVLLGVATAPVGLTSSAGSANGLVYGMTYYPGDGTVGSERMFAIFNDGVLTSNIVEFEVSGGFTSTVFTTIPYTPSPKNIKYSEVFNKLFFTYATTLEAYAPTDGTTTYASITVGGSNLMWPWEDTTNQQMVYFNFATAPTSNIFWIGLDTTNAVACTEEIVNFYQVVSGNNEGPYTWDNATLSWPSACTFTVTDLGTSFSVVATFPGITYQSGILVYSVDNGLTWNNYGDFKTEAQFNAGVTYNKSDVLPYITFMLRIAFLTDDNCGLASKIDTTFN